MAFRSSIDPDGPMQAPGFQFARPSAPIDMERVSRIDLDSIRSHGDLATIKTLQKYVGVLACGDIRSTPVDPSDPRLKAFQLLQLQLQYLVFSHKALRDRAEAAERALERARRHEERAKHRALAKKERVRGLAAEAKTQEEVLASYHALLEQVDPGLAARVTWGDDGRLDLEGEGGGDAGYVELLRWEGGGVGEGAEGARNQAGTDHSRSGFTTGPARGRDSHPARRHPTAGT
mmetsp:Transcript_59894/g.135492  ORF Transcript_59894/g.135492 Transcript_59894/m.135492 type:complete len:233 (+) Transcript_59894:108-806(+)